MSRGGTKKARAAQAEKRRQRERQAKATRKQDRKARRKERRSRGRGKAALLHLSGFAAPAVFAYALLISGAAVDDTEPFWLSSLIDEPNASYFSEPLGFVYLLIAIAFTAAVFILIPLGLWRRVYRGVSVLERDFTSVDSPFTLTVVVAALWVFRAAGGYTDGVGAGAAILAIFSVYVPIFSAILAIGMPVVPGSGRIGGILPNFLRIRFTERYLLSDEDREVLRLFAKAHKTVAEKKAAISDEAEGSEDPGQSDDP